MSTPSGDSGGDDGVAVSKLSIDSMTLCVKVSSGMKGGKISEMGFLSRMFKTKVATASSSNAAASRRTQHDEQMT